MIKSVPDTNVLISAQKSTQARSPNKEYFALWLKGYFELLYSPDTLSEYIEKLYHFNIPDSIIQIFIKKLIEAGKQVDITYFHMQKYPSDSDDTCFVLCAFNGNATHLVSYDSHLLDLNGIFDFTICETIPFLNEVRKESH